MVALIISCFDYIVNPYINLPMIHRDQDLMENTCLVPGCFYLNNFLSTFHSLEQKKSEVFEDFYNQVISISKVRLSVSDHI